MLLAGIIKASHASQPVWIVALMPVLREKLKGFLLGQRTGGASF